MVTLTVNGVPFQYPENGDNDWGIATTLWAQAVTVGMLQKAGGQFILTSDVDFGSGYGLVSLYFTQRTTGAAESGTLRLAPDGSVSWRNNAGTDDVALSLSSGDQLLFNGEAVNSPAITNTQTITGTGFGLNGIGQKFLTILADTSGGAVTMTLGGTLPDGFKVSFKDKKNTFATNAFTIARSPGVLINNTNANLVLSTNGASGDLVTDGTNWWVI